MMYDVIMHTYEMKLALSLQQTLWGHVQTLFGSHVVPIGKNNILNKTRKYRLEILCVPDALCRIAKPVVPLLNKYYSPVPTETNSF